MNIASNMGSNNVKNKEKMLHARATPRLIVKHPRLVLAINRAALEQLEAFYGLESRPQTVDIRIEPSTNLIIIGVPGQYTVPNYSHSGAAQVTCQDVAFIPEGIYLWVSGTAYEWASERTKLTRKGAKSDRI